MEITEERVERAEGLLKFILKIFLSTCLLGCSPPASSTPRVATVTATPTPVQGFMGHVYAYYGGPAVLCESDVCPTSVPMRLPMPNVHVAVVEPETLEIMAETVSLEDGSYQVDIVPGTYRICLKWETGMTCSSIIPILENTYRVEDFDVGQG